MRRTCLVLLLALAGCGGDNLSDRDASTRDATTPLADGGGGPGMDGAITPDDDAAVDPEVDATIPPDPDAGPPPEPCTTRITYGSRWIRGGDHPTSYDDAAGRVTWDGVCVRDGSNSYAVLSNGWRPYFEGTTSCIIALDVRGACETPPPASCTTRVTYGPSWLRAPGHTTDYDEVGGAVTWDGICRAAGGNSSALLSNGWAPHFSGTNGCALSFRHEQCGGLFANPVVPNDCPDPGVTHDGTQYVMGCTGGNFPLRTSPDLVHWTSRGHILSGRPGWASDSMWAPEIHHVGTRWIAYYSGRRAADGAFALGAATADNPLGPYTDLGRPLLTEPHPGIIDVHHFEAPDGTHYLLWKLDGNAVGRGTPIYIQEIADDGITFRGSRRQILTNTLAWEGGLVEGAFMIHHEGTYYLFYSGNGYATSRYAVGVARSSSPLGPFTKRGDPILVSNSSFGGPGHGSIVRGPSGDWVHVYHSWLAGNVGEAPGRVVLVDRITWADGWPRMLSAPSPRSQPML